MGQELRVLGELPGSTGVCVPDITPPLPPHPRPPRRDIYDTSGHNFTGRLMSVVDEWEEWKINS